MSPFVSPIPGQAGPGILRVGCPHRLEVLTGVLLWRAGIEEQLVHIRGRPANGAIDVGLAWAPAASFDAQDPQLEELSHEALDVPAAFAGQAGQTLD
jgi:hypothetical protein